MNEFDYSRLVTNRTSEDVRLRNKRGVYSYDDLNRVAEAVGYIGGLLDSFGYAVGVVPRSDWRENDIPRDSDMREYIAGIRGIDVIRYSLVPVELPYTANLISFGDANNIEKFLGEIGKMAEKIPESWYFCGEIFGGEI